ncbi:VOC family protein [Nakamurella sp. YIM 132087]|uniref:VOC family protein n=1 Tax=Nakamurella alba TaxID=2665158 RepID=A0A7K1FJX2_9ACTN|nr:VOC family protein [Nakamurella alba]MTD14432.1 VOC family protein [Nakamurella alba]
MPELTTCLWFDTEGEQAAELYVSIFPDSRMGTITRYPEGGGRPADLALTVEFELQGQKFVALNGGPQHTFTEAVSFQIPCADQAEIDRYWSLLGDGGEEGPCGWIKDRFGLSWQVIPANMGELMGGDDPDASARAFGAMMQMSKLDIAALEAARAAG